MIPHNPDQRVFLHRIAVYEDSVLVTASKCVLDLSKTSDYASRSELQATGAEQSQRTGHRVAVPPAENPTGNAAHLVSNEVFPEDSMPINSKRGTCSRSSETAARRSRIESFSATSGVTSASSWVM
jgi:hypothetical protein